MLSFKVCLTIAALCVSTNANFYYDRFKALADHGSEHAPRKWTLDSPGDTYEFASSEQQANYGNFPGIKERSAKAIPKENKNFKKALSPFYTITEKDGEKYKAYIKKSGVPYCEEVKTKGSSQKDSMVCYKCKNPKNGDSYEQCSYVFEPSSKSASTNFEEFVNPPSSFRQRRSNSKDQVASGSSTNFKHDKNHRNPYRFSDDIFADVTRDVPEEYKIKDEQCEKVVKDSMVCMVCKDAKTNGKYEQCSYIRKPQEKSYAYLKSSSFKNPKKTEEQEEKEDSENHEDRKYSESKPVKEEREYSYPSEAYNKKSEAENGSEEGSNGEETSSNCKRVQKDSETCMVCKDPKTGGNYEKCSYSYQPNDKVYKFSRSKSFGYPGSSSSEESENPGDKEKSSEAAEKLSSYPEAEYQSDYSIPESYYEKPQETRSSTFYKENQPKSKYRQASSNKSKSKSYKDDDGPSFDFPKSESERLAESTDPSNCKKVEKDSMICNVCKDPKTGTDFEQCSYVYKPKEKSYSYSKSRSFGNPSKEQDDDTSYRKSEKQTESEEPSDDDKRGYNVFSERKPYVAASANQREFRERPISSELKSNSKEVSNERSNKNSPQKVDVEFYDASKKKAEIEKFLQEFQKEDRSNCKKVMRDKMTCYQCVDDKGFQKEECAFITDEPSKEKIAYHEVKEFRKNPVKKVPRSTVVKQSEKVEDSLEPETSASENLPVKRAKPVDENSENVKANKEKSQEVEAYDYAQETKPIYDKTLGFSLPAYMLEKSEQEAEFDEILSGRF